MDFSIDDQKLVIGLENNSVIILDLKTTRIDTLTVLNSTPTCLYISTSEEMFAMGQENGSHSHLHEV